MEQNNKTQIVFVHGGNSFDNITEFYEDLRQREFDPYQSERKKWRDAIKDALIETHECIMPRMPNAMNADYEAWSIWLEKLIPYLRDGVILVGHSLGSGFLLRYLSDNKLPITVSQLHLVAGVIDDKDCPGLGEFGIDITTWKGFASALDEVHIWHSNDDDSVSIHHATRLVEKYSEATTHYFTDRGHFLQPEFPAVIKN
jgi:predicted alpha/beta hydrolase family esterase